MSIDSLMTCKICNRQIRVKDRLLHLRDEHPDEYTVHLDRMRAARWPGGKKSRRQADPDPASTESPPATPKSGAKGGAPRTSTSIATAQAPAPAAIVFNLGQIRVEMDPSKLVEMYILITDMQKCLGLKDDFSTVLLDCVESTYRLAMAHVVLFDGGVAVVKVEHNGHGANGNGHTEEDTELLEV